MEFPKFNTANTHTLHITDFTKGISTNQATHKNNLGTLSDCKNVWAEKGILKTRPALSTAINREIFSSEFSDGYYYNRSVKDIEIKTDNDTKRLILEEIDLDLSHYVCLTHFVGSSGKIDKTASIMFSRISDDTFYIPNKIHFFKGKPQNGAGVFTIVFTVNSENYTQTDCRIYELSEDFTQWDRIYTPYIPTALINGRGNKYELAKSTNQAFTGTPTRLEPLNILDPTFHAYFSTDGRSSAFRLPFSGLSNGRVICRLYYSVDSFAQWLIEENQTSASTTLYGVSVTMNVNREKGIINFTVPAGEYEVPLISDRNENNLRVTATKKCDYSAFDVANATAFSSFDGKILAGTKNKLYEANFNNPLYFPIDSSITVGSGDFPITAIAKLGEKLIALKENEIYTLEIKSGKKLSGTSLLAETDREFWETDKITVSLITEGIGCKESESVISQKNAVYWLGTDNRIYSITGGGKVTAVTEALDIGRYLKASGTSFEDYILFFNYNTAFAVNCESTAMFYWEFPANIRFLGCYCQNGNVVILCRNTSGDVCFTAGLEEICDQYLAKSGTTTILNEADVKSLISTSKLSLGCDNSLKKLDKVILRLKGEATVRINDRFSADVKSDAEDFSSIALTTGICGIDLTNIEITSNSPLSLGSADIKYTSLKL